MARAFVLIKHERRIEGTRRPTYHNPMTDDATTRHIPVNYSEEEKEPNAVVFTTMKAITWLIGYTTALVIVTSLINSMIMGGSVKDIKLMLAQDYARKGEIIGAAVYHLEQTEQNNRMLRQDQEIENLRRLVEAHDRQITTNTEHLNRISSNGKR